VPSLPTTATGKIQKFLLREQLVSGDLVPTAAPAASAVA
jgi:acyl-coenzyme A synthetase/AMP-(fatty) acid ligase